MALKVAYTFNGLQAPEAYLRIDGIQGNKDEFVAQISIFANKARAADTNPLTAMEVRTPLVKGEDIYTTVYKAAKAKLIGAVDD